VAYDAVSRPDLLVSLNAGEAAGVPPSRVEALVAADQLRPVAGTFEFFAPADAIAAVRSLRGDGGRAAAPRA